MQNEIVGFKASNDNGVSWFYWQFNDHFFRWVVDEPESLKFTTEEMLRNAGGYSRCEPIYE